MWLEGSVMAAETTLALPLEVGRVRRNPLWVVWRFARANPLGTAGAVIVVVLILSAVFAPVIATTDPNRVFIGSQVKPPGAVSRDGKVTFLWGTDDFGRDVFSRVVYGARVSLLVGFMSVGLGTLGGSIIGLISGFWGRWVDLFIQRVMDAIMCFPGLILALAIVSVLGPSTRNSFLAIVIVIIPGASRIVRGATMSVKQNVYVEAARAVGASEWRILGRHILPNVVAPIIVIASVTLGGAILTEASLSFLGLGTQPPTASWGQMLSGPGRRFLENHPNLAIFPGLALSLTVFAFNFLGDALRDVFDPRLRGKL
jgi:peptide/nickel transport system permease protein